MAGASYDREKYKVAIPQLDAKLKKLLDENVTITKQTINIVKTVEEIDTDYQYFKNLATGYFTAIAGNVEYLTSRQAYIAKLGSDIAEFGFLTADSAEIQNLKVGNLEIGGVSVNIYDFATDARKRATYYLTDLDDGVFVHAEDSDNMEPTDPDAHGVYITDQVDIIRQGKSVAMFGETARIGKQTDIHADIQSNALALKIENDRLFEVKSDGIFNYVYFGQSTKADGATYTDASVRAIYSYLVEFCEPDSNMEKIVTIADHIDTGYTLSYDESTSQSYGMDVYDILDVSGNKFRSASFFGLQYMPDRPNVKYTYDFILGPASEYQGAPVIFDMGNAQISASGDTVQITNTLKVGNDGAFIQDNQVFQVDSGNDTTAFYINDSAGIYFNASNTLDTLITNLGWDADLQ